MRVADAMEQHAVGVTALVGRAGELATVQRRLTALERDQGALVLITGEPGIGKTALALACASLGQAMGAAVAIGRCHEGGGQPPYAPWSDVLAALESAAGTDDASLPPPFGAGPPAQSAYQLVRVVAKRLTTIARGQPIVLVLEDLHWADTDALELLDVATRDHARAPILVIATYRPEAVHRAHPFYNVLPRLQRDRPVELLRLGELSAEETLRLVQARHGGCSRKLADFLHARADGQPLFIIELVRDLLERHVLPRDEQGQLLPPLDAVRVSALLRHLIAHRVARLGADVEALLVVAAVIGEEWDLATVEAVLGWEEEPLLRALDGALAAEVVVPVDEHIDRYRFRHALIREVLYVEQMPRRRKHLHQRVGLVLEAADSFERSVNHAALAFHFGLAEVWEKAARYGLAAGDAARDRYAGHGAVLSYQQALEALERAPPEVERELLTSLLERLGQAYMVVSEREAAATAFRQMLDAARRSNDRPAEVRALCWVNYIQRRLYDVVGSEVAAEEALRAAEAVGEPRLLGLAHWSLGHHYEVTGALDRSAHHAGEAARIARTVGDRDVLARSLMVLAHLAIWHGRYREGQGFAEEALDSARASHDALAAASSHWRLGIALCDLGHYDAARRELLAGVALAESAGERYYLAKILNTVGWLHFELGDPEGAMEWDRRALETVRESGSSRRTEAEHYTLLNLATDAMAAGKLDAAAEILSTFESFVDQVEYARFRYLNRYQLTRAELALAQGRMRIALDAAAEAADLAASKDMPKNVAKSLLVRGRVMLAMGRHRDAADVLAEGVTIADRLEHGSLRWQGRLWLGKALDALRQDASEIYRGAWDYITAIADALEDDAQRVRFLASPLVEQVRTAATASSRRGATASPAGLTSRELDVLRLLADHRTDKEIAEALSISPRTVGAHVGSILDKLGVETRRGARDVALAQRLV
jgi:ATP/maltotriose-dependent transcriptional regulator MalT